MLSVPSLECVYKEVLLCSGLFIWGSIFKFGFGRFSKFEGLNESSRKKELPQLSFGFSFLTLFSFLNPRFQFWSHKILSRGPVSNSGRKSFGCYECTWSLWVTDAMDTVLHREKERGERCRVVRGKGSRRGWWVEKGTKEMRTFMCWSQTACVFWGLMVISRLCILVLLLSVMCRLLVLPQHLLNLTLSVLSCLLVSCHSVLSQSLCSFPESCPSLHSPVPQCPFSHY